MIDADIRVEGGNWVGEDRLAALVKDCIEAAVDEIGSFAGHAELAILFSDDTAQRMLNAEYRGKDTSTNVLSFPAGETPAHPGMPRFLGDMSLAFGTIAREAEAGDMAFDVHLRHLIIHGLLHLLGYDHDSDADASIMETTETRALARLGIADPYRSDQV